MGWRVAVAHYPEGAGHATRMLAIARAFEAAGTDVVLAGGGPGGKYLELNGYEQFQPTSVDFIGDYQGGGSILDVLTRSGPHSAGRVADFKSWLDREQPDALVTDDMFAAMAAPLADVPLFILTHNAASYYDAAIQQAFTWLINRYQLAVAQEFLYPALWGPDHGDPPGVTYVPPIALECPEARNPDDVGVLVVPSTYSQGFDVLADQLREEGHDVTLVGDGDWTDVPALLPWVRAADVVVCSGYSTVMEAAVGATPCIIYPFTDEQHGVSRVIERRGLAGFQVEHSIPHVARAVRHPPRPPDYRNGADTAAASVLEHLS